MKNDLTCGVVRDLLPSYLEGLLSVESKEAVERHLETCPGCTAQKDAMSAQTKETALEVVKEVDYLKRVKKSNWKRIVLAAAATAVLVLGGLGLKVFVIGTPLQPQSVMVTVAEVREGGILYLSLVSPTSGNAFHSWKVEVEDGVASVTAREVLASSLHRTGQAQVNVSLADVREVWLGGTSGRLLWTEGVVITQKTLDLLEAKTPYCGDASAVGRIIDLLKIKEVYGSYSIVLQTSSEPYICTLEFLNPLDQRDWRGMRAYLFQMLALVGNLDEVRYTYEPADAWGREEGNRMRDGGVTAEEASVIMANMTRECNDKYGTDWPVHESIKEYAESPLEYQRMVMILGERFDYWQYPG